MDKVYRANYKKVTVLLVTFILMGFIFLIWLWLYIHQFSLKIIITVFALSFFMPSIYKIKQDFNMMLTLNNICLQSARYRKVIAVNWNAIKQIEYTGMKHFKLSDMMIIHSDKEDIYVDFNYKEYRKLWWEIIRLTKQANPQAIIDKEFFNMIDNL